ncbi:SP_0009 family protein [Streptococcus dentiloxodontae]
MNNLIKNIETFLAYSDDKLEELAAKNQALKTEQLNKAEEEQEIK